MPSRYDPSEGPRRPTNLRRAAIRAPDPEEPPGDYTVLEVPAPPVLLRVYFAVPLDQTRVLGLPTRMVERAQAELDTLRIPQEAKPIRVFPGGAQLPDEGLDRPGVRERGGVTDGP